MNQFNFPQINPSTTSLDRSFNNSEIILVTDHMPHVQSIHLYIDNNERFFQNTIIDLFDSAGIDYKEKIFVFDSYMCFEDFKTDQTVFTNEWLFTQQIQEFIKSMPDWNRVPRISPTKKLSAMMNKVRPNRIITSVLLANLFNSEEIAYSFKLDDDFSLNLVISELLSKCEYDIDTTRVLDNNWIESTKPNIIDAITFRDFLYAELFAPATISLITEPTFFENGVHLSEKTLMSVYAGHFPIWVGSYKAAECAERLGLDIFNDVIDHSYQYIEHPGKRSVEAILKNIELLSNIELQTHLRNKMYGRLDDNLKLMRDLNKLKSTMREEFNSDNLELYDYLRMDT